MTDLYTSLHTHSQFSLSDGVSSPEEIARYVDTLDMECCALTDHGVLTGIFPFDKAMRDAGRHPLIGCEAYLTLGPTRQEGEAIADNFHQTILLKSLKGWRHLNHLMWRAYAENFYYKPRIHRDWLVAEGDGLVILSGCIGSLINQSIIAALFPDTAADTTVDGLFKAVSSGAKARKRTGIELGNLDAARAHFRWYHERFGDDFYVELMDHGMAEEAACARHLIAWAEQEGVTIVATNDTHYLTDADYAMQQIITAGSRQGKDDEEGGIGHAGLSLKTGAAMLALPLFHEYPQAVANTVLVAEKCVDFVLPKPTNLLPQFPLPKGETNVDSYLWKQVVAGATKRYGHFSGAVRERAEYEFGVVRKMNFADYFMVVADFIQWAKRKGIRVGPARGCLAPDVPIILASGRSVPIADVRVGDEVWTQNGIASRVVRHFTYPCSERLIRLRSYYGDDRGVTLTADHKVLALPTNRPDEGATLSWRRADSLTKDDWLFIPKPQVAICSSFIDFSPYINGLDIVDEGEYVATHKRSSTGTRSRLMGRTLKRFPLDEEWAGFLGMFVGNGAIPTRTTTYVTMSFNREHAGKIASLTEMMHRYGISVKRHDQGGGTTLEIRSKTLRLWLREILPEYRHTAITKHVPASIMNASEEIVEAFLRGLQQTDGTLVASKGTISTSSPALADQIRFLLLRLGIPSTRGRVRSEEKRARWKASKPSYAIVFPADKRITGIASKRAYVYHSLPNGILVKVLSTENVDATPTVHDIEVEEAHNYLTSSFVVHNSAAGSLLVYALGITDIDPLQYGLIFERFLNEGRVSLPDIDADFADDRRGEVVKYVTEKYGADKVAGIATFGTLLAAGAIKAVGRAKNLSFEEQNTLSKLFPAKVGAPPMHEAVQLPAVQAYLATLAPPDRARMDEVLDIAIQVNGRTNSMGRHAAGIVISREPLVDHLPLMISKGERLVGVTMGWAEELGLLKMDFLGLKTLTVMERAEALITARTGAPFSVDTAPLDDEDTYALLRQGELMGVFQIEGGTGTLCTQMIAPTNLDDIVAIMALGRPGPMDHAPAFADRKHGRAPVVYPHPALEAVLAPTQGFALFQEQVMEVARLLADYSLTEADELRKAMGKKLPAAMAKHRERFVTGCAARHIDEESAHALFDELEKFSGYGFNKSHSVGYGLIAYRTAYLSAHYPGEFLAALLTSEFGDGDRTAAIIAAARRRGLTILPPAVNASQRDCTLEEGAIRLGLGLIKGVGDAVARRIAAHAPYIRLDHLLLKDGANVNTGVLKALILSGACDDLLPGGASNQRLAIAAVVDDLSKETTRRLGLKRNTWDPRTDDAALPHGPWLPCRLAALLRAEKGALGCYLTMDPLVELAARAGAGAALADVPDYADDADLPTDFWHARRYLVEAREVKVVETKVKREEMAICDVADAAETLRSLTIFPRLYAPLKAAGFTDGTLLAVTARPERYNGKIQLIAVVAAVVDLEAVEAAIDREEERKMAVLHLAPSAYQWSQEIYRGFLKRTVEIPEFSGDCPLLVHYPDGPVRPYATIEGRHLREVAERLSVLFGARLTIGQPDLVWREQQFLLPLEGKR